MGQALSADRKHSKAQAYRNSAKSSLQGFEVRRAKDRFGSIPVVRRFAAAVSNVS